MRTTLLMNRLTFRLPSEVWIVQVGIFLNMLGYGAVLPFELVYLVDGRGFTLAFAGAVVGTIHGIAVVAAPAAGPLIDRIGAKRVAGAGGLALAAGYCTLGFATVPGVALAGAAVAGIGNGALIPSQSALLASLTSRDLRHRAAAVSRVAANIGFGLGGALGGVVATYGLAGFVLLYLANALTYALYVGILFVAVRAEVRPPATPGSYRTVIRDRTFLRLIVTNVAVIAIGWGVLPWVVPPYAVDDVGIGSRLIGLLMLANALTVVLAQIPVAKLVEGRRRLLAMKTGAFIFAAACLACLAANSVAMPYAYVLLLLAAVAIGVGECFHSTALMPLVADLAPDRLRGRYMAAMGLSWWVGLAITPVLGTRLLGIGASAAFLPAASVALLAAISMGGLERRTPPHMRMTPRPSAPRPATEDAGLRAAGSDPALAQEARVP